MVAPPVRDAEPRAAVGRIMLLTAAVVVFLAWLWRYSGYLIDDAYISLRYARNLVEGHGLVFNPGERVEGYTNLLWVLLGALFLSLDWDAMRALGAVSLVSTVGLLATVYVVDRRLGAGAWLPAVAWLLPLQAMGYWATTGMESMLFAALLTLAVALKLAGGRAWPASALVFVGLASVRPEGALCFALCWAIFAIRDRWLGGRWPLRRMVVEGLLFTLPWSAHVAWRYSYYGEFLPNTYYAKLTGGWEQWQTGGINVGQFLVAFPTFALTLVAVPLLIAISRRRDCWPDERRRGIDLLAVWLLTIAWIFYVGSAGGDFMPFFRFFLPILGLLAVLTNGSLALASTAFPERFSRLGIPLTTLLLLLHVVANAVGVQPYRAFVAHRTTVIGERVGEYLAAELGGEATVAVNTAGSLPYASRLPTIDMLGLTDPVIARHPVYVVSPLWAGHRRGFGEYVLSRQPKAVLWYNSAGLDEPHYLGDHQLADNPYFRFFYQMRRVVLESNEGTTLLARFLGAPFGGTDGNAGDVSLGVSFELRASPWLHTLAFEAPVSLRFFELRSDRKALWSLRDASSDLNEFLGKVVERWRRENATTPAIDEAARRQVERLCDQALAYLQQNERGAAKEALSRAAEINSDARSPRVYQYIANLAYLEKDLFLAVHAQQEALRLEPENDFYRANLRRLLTVPWKEFRRDVTASRPGF